MGLRSPHGCGADVQLEAESITHGGRVWAKSGIAATVSSADAHGAPACAGGCPLTDAQTAALEQRAAETYAFGLDVAPAAQRAAAELAWDAGRNR